MLVEVKWSHINGSNDPMWRSCRVLYAYLHPVRDWLMYVGKADRQSVRQRWNGEHKSDVFDWIEERYGVREARVLVGDLVLDDGRNFSSELLADAESLLIKRLQPAANVQARVSRIERRGLRVRCLKGWPFKRALFIDQ